ncbi:hypothetical protein [Rhodococcus sp. H29-C3]|uniref:hypothetical protein n=1 Tax=Rhodococcus sp. H29-C3 TaxID=3046307 RepID=UPI0024BA2954|nr:hypothetical protein [Rhodococcus sp. H29-C3]MDJ0363126.1 hypothetical protein [Rhodococcus sp. H29-C3]
MDGGDFQWRPRGCGTSISFDRENIVLRDLNCSDGALAGLGDARLASLVTVTAAAKVSGTSIVVEQLVRINARRRRHRGHDLPPSPPHISHDRQSEPRPWWISEPRLGRMRNRLRYLCVHSMI